uniref:hypothetical protein n=1 Tax=Lactococcus garvieae TaxID=1363 RepID=UPI00359C56E2
MTSKSIQELANELHLEKKQLQNKLNYWKKKGKDTWNFSDTFSDGVRILSVEEQQRVCELLKIPFFRQVSEANSDTQNQVKSEFWKEKIHLLEQQLTEIKADKEYLKTQILQGQNEKQELIKANTELRILLQNTLKQTDQMQTALSEFVSENQKEEKLSSFTNTNSNSIQNPSENTSYFEFNPTFLNKKNTRLKRLINWFKTKNRF